MKRTVMPWVAAGVLGIALYSVARTQPTTVVNAPPWPPPSSESSQRVAATGMIEPRSENVAIAPHLSGVIQEILVAVGQDVRAGDPLVVLDTRALQATREERRVQLKLREAEVLSAEARVGRIQAVVEEARRHLQFAESLKDSRAISAEELNRRRGAVETAEAELVSGKAEVEVARVAVSLAGAALASVETEIDRSTVRAPMDGRILQVRIRRGEFAMAGVATSPWMILGDVSVLHLRVDIDEHEAWRVRQGATAVAQVRGNSALRVDASFVRFEPLVIPKVSLTGSSMERVDTRVLQAIYRVGTNALPLYVGQQMDVFLDATDSKEAVARGEARR